MLGRLTERIETTKKQNMTTIMVLFIAYITILSCKTVNAFLYGGYVALMGILVVRVMFWDNCRLLIPKITQRLLWFIGYSCLSAVWAYDSSLAFAQIPLLLACGFLVVFMGDYIIKKDLSEIMVFMVAVIGLCLSVYVVLYYGGFGAFYNQATTQQANLSAQRMGGDINNVNIIGLQCTFSVIVLLYYALIKNKKFYYLLMIIPAITAFASGSRKALLLLIIGFVMVTYYKLSFGSGTSKYLKIYLGTFAIIIGIIIILSTDIAKTSVERFSMSVATDGGMDSSTELRVEFVKNGLKHFWDYPYLGWGLGNSPHVNAIYLGLNMYSHSDIIELLVNGGAVGFILYYGLVYKVFKMHLYYMKRNREDSVVFISFVIFTMHFVSSIAVVSYYNSIPNYVYWILWITVLETRRRKEIADNEVDKKNN